MVRVLKLLERGSQSRAGITPLIARRNSRPILFVDVDGVISLFGFDADRPPNGEFRWINGILHYISAPCGSRLLRLAEHYELVWATGWEETANEYLPHLLGLSRKLPVLSFDGRARFGTAHWKIAAIDEYAGPKRAVAWIDDCLDERCEAWAEARSGPTLLVPTRPHEGMLDAHVDRLIAWADDATAPLATEPARQDERLAG